MFWQINCRIIVLTSNARLSGLLQPQNEATHYVLGRCVPGQEHVHQNFPKYLKCLDQTISDNSRRLQTWFRWFLIIQDSSLQTFPDPLQIFVTYLYDPLDYPSYPLKTLCDLKRSSPLHATHQEKPKSRERPCGAQETCETSCIATKTSLDPYRHAVGDHIQACKYWGT